MFFLFIIIYTLNDAICMCVKGPDLPAKMITTPSILPWQLMLYVWTQSDFYSIIVRYTILQNVYCMA